MCTRSRQALLSPTILSYAGTVTLRSLSRVSTTTPSPRSLRPSTARTPRAPTIEYDGEAVEPVVVRKSGSATIDAADYTVTYTDEDGEAVESIVEPGEYTGTVDFGNATWGHQRRQQ